MGANMDHQETAEALLTTSCMEDPCKGGGPCACRDGIAAALQDAFDMGFRAAGGTVTDLTAVFALKR
jgi:hypothetical protein